MPETPHKEALEQTGLVVRVGDGSALYVDEVDLPTGPYDVRVVAEGTKLIAEVSDDG